MITNTPIDSEYPLSDADGAASLERIDYVEKDHSRWTALAQSNFNTARSYQDASLTSQWERNADHFNNKHYRRSAYNTRMYQGRSRLFRPLSRASERASTAQAAAAFFSNIEIVDIQPRNQNDKNNCFQREL